MERALKIEDRGSKIEEDTRSRTSILDLQSSIIDSLTPTAGLTIALEQDLCLYLSTLDSLAYRLIDEQLRLVKQCQQLAEARAQWEKEHHARAKDLESRNLQLRKDERALEERMEKFRQRDLETNQTRQSLETWQARITLETVSWKAERERLLAQIHSLEIQADRLSAILGELPADWQGRLSQGDSAVIQKHRQAQAEAEYARLRQELRSLQDQRASYERQVADLTALVDRLAALLIEDESTPSLPAARAA
jgi:chromosome segregation ATPase